MVEVELLAHCLRKAKIITKSRGYVDFFEEFTALLID